MYIIVGDKYKKVVDYGVTAKYIRDKVSAKIKRTENSKWVVYKVDEPNFLTIYQVSDSKLPSDIDEVTYTYIDGKFIPYECDVCNA